MTIAPEQTTRAEAAATATPPRRDIGNRGRGWLSVVFLPVLLVVVCIVLYAYVHGQRLDSIEQRSLNRAFLVSRVFEHVRLTAVSTVFVILFAIPLGVLLTRPAMRRASPVVLGIVNVGQAVPSIGVLVLFALVVGIGFGPAVVALVIYSFLPVLRNTMAGLKRVDRALIDAGRGMGMTKRGILFRVELPLAVPVMMAGIRVALIINVGTATLATFTNAHGLGDVIDAGLRLNRTPVLVTGAVLVAVLALTIDWLAGLAERMLRPRGL